MPLQVNIQVSNLFKDHSADAALIVLTTAHGVQHFRNAQSTASSKCHTANNDPPLFWVDLTVFTLYLIAYTAYSNPPS